MDSRLDGGTSPHWLDVAFIAVVGAFLASYFFSLFLAPPLLRLLPLQHVDMARTLIMALTHQVFILVCVTTVCVMVDRRRSIFRKLRLVHWRASYMLEAVGWELVCFPLIAVATVAFAVLLDRLGVDAGKPAILIFLLHCDWSNFAVIAFAAVIMAPITEEIMFRRIVFGFLSRRLPRLVSFLTTSALFALIHLSLPQFPGLLILGMALQWIYLRHRSLFPSIAFHCFHNAIAIGILLILRIHGVDKIPGLELANP